MISIPPLLYLTQDTDKFPFDSVSIPFFTLFNYSDSISISVMKETSNPVSYDFLKRGDKLKKCSPLKVIDMYSRKNYI